MPCYSALKGWKDPQTGGIVFRRSFRTQEPMQVACGSCLGCRLDKSRMWAARIVHEAHQWDDNCFITLTYNDEHLPYGGTLVKEHFQKFMKRLRKRFTGRTIRYYHCGEYGEKLNRPHYHACLFNFDFPDKELFHENEGQFLFVSEILGELWPYGFHTIGDLTFQSAAYCARYVTKKVTGKKAHEHYLRLVESTGELIELEPEYSTMSRRPGIGRDFYEEFKNDFFPSDELPVPGVGVLKKVPRYYAELLRQSDPDLLDSVKASRDEFRKEHADEYTPKRLMDKYRVQKRKLTMLKRGLESET